MSACSRLVGAFPTQPTCCELWCRCALPLVRDAEAAVQDEAAKQGQELLLARAAAAAGNGAAAQGVGATGCVLFQGGRDCSQHLKMCLCQGGKVPLNTPCVRRCLTLAMHIASQPPPCCPAVPASTQELLPLLAALALVGRSAAGCLAKVLAAAAVRKVLDAAKVARGLEAIIGGKEGRGPA